MDDYMTVLRGCALILWNFAPAIVAFVIIEVASIRYNRTHV